MAVEKRASATADKMCLKRVSFIFFRKADHYKHQLRNVTTSEDFLCYLRAIKMYQNKS